MGDLFAIGIFAGLALAIPVGPMALLLIQTTIQRGLSAGIAGGLGMATVDFLYAIAAFTMGGLVTTFLGSSGGFLSWVGGLILAGFGARTAVSSWRTRNSNVDSVVTQKITASRNFFRFVAATLVNPPTALYFVALAATFAQKFSRTELCVLEFSSLALTFGLGVFLGSGLWQESLAVGAHTLKKWLSVKAQKWIGVSSGVLIVALAVKMVVAP
ncbi:MAG: LysE family translocator [Micrococcales bacterium]